MKPRRVLVDPEKPESIVEQLNWILYVLDAFVERGDPQDPTDPSSTTRAGSSATAHNGTVSNEKGAWVEVELSATGRTPVECFHNLYIGEDSGYTIPVSGEPNVRWQVMGWMHNGTGDTSAILTLNVYFLGGTVNTNSIELEFDVVLSSGALTVNGDNPIVCSLWFTRATRL